MTQFFFFSMLFRFFIHFILCVCLFIIAGCFALVKDIWWYPLFLRMIHISNKQNVVTISSLRDVLSIIAIKILFFLIALEIIQHKLLISFFKLNKWNSNLKALQKSFAKPLVTSLKLSKKLKCKKEFVVEEKKNQRN